MQKEYKMLFRLGAKLGEDFNGTFNSAQNVLKTTQKEIQAMNRLQSDISAYQKQQQSIDATNERLKMYRTQLQNTQKELADTGNKSSDLQNKEEDLKLKIKNTELALSQKNAKLAQMSDKLTNAGVDVTKLSDESKRLATDMQELKKQEEQAAKEAEQFGNKGSSAFEAVGSALATAGIAAGLKKIEDAYKQCVDISMQFNSTMSTVEALSGANASEMSTLSETAKNLGATTVYTANQSAEAMTYMGMAGWDAQQMVSGMDGVLNLAAASGEDLASVSDIVTDNLTAFGLTARDTAHFSDVLAAAATNSNTSVGIMGETFKGSASIAGALGYSIEDVATAVGLMANAGVKGTIAGTALKNTFNGLLNGATLTGSALGEVEYTAIKSDGTLKSFGETIDELRGYFQQMTEAERVQNAMTLAGQRGYNGLLAIINATDADYQKLSDSINNCTGAAQKMADIKLDNLQGDVTLLNSAADGLKMTIGDAFQNELRGIVQLGTKIITNINDFCEENPGVVKAIMAVTAEIGLVVAGYTAFNAVKKVKNTLSALGTALETKNAAAVAASTAAETAEAAAITKTTTAQKLKNAAVSAGQKALSVAKNPLVIGTASVAAVTAGIMLVREATKQQEFSTLELSSATKDQTEKVSELQAEYDKVVNTYGSASDKARSLKYDLDEATAAVDAQKFSVSDLYSEIDTLHSSTSDLISSIDSGAASIDNNYESAQILITKLRELTSTSDDSAVAQAKIEPIIARLNQMYPNLGLTVDNVKSKMEGLNNVVEQTAATSGYKERVQAAKDSLSELYVQQEQLQDIYKKAEKANAEAKKKFDNAMGDTGYLFAWKYYVTQEIPNAEKDYDEAFEKYMTAAADLDAVDQKIYEQQKILAEYGKVYNGTSDDIVSSSLAISAATDEVTDSAEALIASYNNAYKAAYDSVSGQYALWDDAADVEEIAIEDMNDSLQSQTEYWNDYSENVEKILKKSNKISGLKDMIATFSDGSKDSVDAIAGMADASDEDLAKIVDSWKNLQTAQEKASDSLADVRVDFDAQLSEIEKTMNDRIDKMLTKDEEAKTAAKTMIDAYCQALINGKGSVADAASIVGEAAAAALAGATSYDATNANTTGNQYINGITNQSSNTSESEQLTAFGPSISELDYNYFLKNSHSGGGGTRRGYATGTNYAEKGIALVGEQGPELIAFGGGEKVINSRNTSEILSGGNRITIAPVINVSGNADKDTLDVCVENIIEQVKQALREQGIDNRRNAYA